jgi:ADP-dependent NAD(P)H-hydrate dehydratase / NAD(P)H-hydrate epimerase
MKLLATAEVMRGFDQIAIERFGIPGLVLMENAGRACVDVLEHRIGSVAGKHVVVACGKGNNGGDGFVIARHLFNHGARVDVLLLSPAGKLSGDAATNFKVLPRLQRISQGRLKILGTAGTSALQRAEGAEVIIDAIFGTGFSGVPKGRANEMILWINHQPGVVMAVDIPSGIDATTGEARGNAVRAAFTVTMGAAKPGHYVGAGRLSSGEVHVADISIPPDAMRPPAKATFLVEESDVVGVVPPRPFNAHKYSVGKVLVIAGSRSFTGAPVLTSLAALKSGAGAVVLCVPSSIHGMIVRKVTDVIVVPCAETPAGTLAERAMEDLEDRLQWADVVIIGPGLSRNDETDALVRSLVVRAACPLVLDADGLNAMGGHARILRARKAPTILTPHTGELSRLVGTASAELDTLRVEAARGASDSLNSIVVLKGAPTVTASKGVAVLNVTGNPGMATIGSGDVLTGMIAALIGQGGGCFEAAYAGVFLHGRAGDLAARRLGERSILASDILSHIPGALGAPIT